MTDKLPEIYVAFPCYGQQDPQWWSQVFAMLMSGNGKFYNILQNVVSSSMMQDTNKNQIVAFKRRDSMTDANRNELTKGFMESGADFMFFIDDDTVPPGGALARLLSLRREFVSGLYFLPKKPWNPIAYFKEPNTGLYANYTGYAKGTLVEVDAVGLGCALIHRDVFTKIEETHSVFVRYNGAMYTFPKRLVRNKKPMRREEAFVKDGAMHVPVREPTPDDDRYFPFFALEHGRTEDMVFCEMAKEAGVQIWLDTTVVCDHFKFKPTTEEDYKRGMIEQAQEAIRTDQL